MTDLEVKKELMTPPGAKVLEMIENFNMSQTELEAFGKEKGENQ